MTSLIYKATRGVISKHEITLESFRNFGTFISKIISKIRAAININTLFAQEL